MSFQSLTPTQVGDITVNILTTVALTVIFLLPGFIAVKYRDSLLRIKTTDLEATIWSTSISVANYLLLYTLFPKYFMHQLRNMTEFNTLVYSSVLLLGILPAFWAVILMLGGNLSGLLPKTLGKIGLGRFLHISDISLAPTLWDKLWPSFTEIGKSSWVIVTLNNGTKYIGSVTLVSYFGEKEAPDQREILLEGAQITDEDDDASYEMRAKEYIYLKTNAIVTIKFINVDTMADVVTLIERHEVR